METITHALLHTLEHTAIILPLLYLTYLLIGYLNKGKGVKIQHALQSRGGANVLLASALGAIPQCGFSTTVAQLFCDKKVTIGVLFAVIISTSDEALTIFIAYGEINLALIFIGIKVAIAIVVGFIVDKLWKPTIHEDNDICYDVTDEHHCHCSQEGNIWLFALKKALTLFAIVFAVGFALELIIDFWGEDKLSTILLSNSIFQPLVIALIGLIPNCAVTVVLAELIVSGAISMGAGIAGLITAGGFGLVVLIKNNKNRWLTAKIIGILYLIGAGSGMILQFVL